MGRLIDIHEIDEFSEVVTVPLKAVTDEILSSIRHLDEKREMEPFLRQILYDPNETPHGPTEIADILTTHVHVTGEKQLAAFVLKGKSWPKVSARDVAHQLTRVRQVQGLGLLVLSAVGDIQDDAQRDFFQIASDGRYDHLIIDAGDLARLLIAYDKICPRDGTPYDETGMCREGHWLDEGIRIEIDVREEIRYSVLKLKDVSHAGAKRYRGTILLDRHYPRDVIREVIQESTHALRHENYYRNEHTKSRWGETPAHVVWMFIAHDLEDVAAPNWVCRSMWLDPSLPGPFRPFPLRADEWLDDIAVAWNHQYRVLKRLYAANLGTKQQVVEGLQAILKPMVRSASRATELFGEYTDGRMSEEDFVSAMQKMEPQVRELYLESMRIPLPPQDCTDYEQACQDVFAIIDNVFLFYSERGLRTWPKKNRDWLMQDAVNRYYEHIERIKFEEAKLD